MNPPKPRTALIVAGGILLSLALGALFVFLVVEAFTEGSRNAALAWASFAIKGAMPAAVGVALAGAYRLEQRFVSDWRLGLVFLAAVGVSYLALRPGLAPLAGGSIGGGPGELLLASYVAGAFLVGWFVGPAAWATDRAIGAWLQGGIPAPARIAGTAACGFLVAALVPVAFVSVFDLASGGIALASLTASLVARVPAPLLIGAGAILRLLLTLSGAAG